MNHDVFISYSSKDLNTALALCHFLEENKIRCWMAPRDIPGGVEYGDAIDEAIQTARVLVVLYSSRSSVSRWVKSEVNIALSSGKMIIPFKIEDVPLNGSMRLYLNDKHWIDAFPSPEEHFGSLLASVKSVLSGNVSLSPDIKSFKPTSKYLRLVQILFSTIFGMIGVCGMFNIGSEYHSKLCPWMRYTYPVVMLFLFLIGLWLSYVHPIAKIKSASFKALKNFMCFEAIRNAIMSLLRVFFSWSLICIGALLMLSCPMTIAMQFINKPVVDVVVILGILSLGVPVFCVGLPIFKAGWALIDRNYAKFSFTPKQLLKWILVILIPCLLYGILISLFPSLKMDSWDNNGQSEVPTITDETLNAFRNSKWKDGIELSREADRTNPDLQFYLGLCYERGCGVSNDYAEALHWYRLSADNGNACAQCNLGLMYEKGLGVAQDFKKASEWYLKSSESGNPNAKAFLGDLYEHGKGVDQDVQKAKRLYLESLIANGTLKGVTNASDLASALEADQSFAGMALMRMSLLSFPLLSDCRVNPDERFVTLMKTLQKIVEMLQKQGVVANQGNMPDLASDTLRVLGPDDDLEAVVEDCVPGSVIMLREGVYNLDKTIYIKKPIKISGSGTDKTRLLGGRFNIDAKDFLLINMTFENARDGYGIWCDKDSEGCVAACNFVGCGIRFSDSSCAVLTGVNVSAAKWGVSISKDASVVYLGGSIERCSEHCIIAFDNATIWAVALLLSECGGNAVRLNGAGGRLFMGSCEISNIKDAGITLTANASARLSGVSIVSCAKEAIYTRGECVHRQLKVEDCKLPIKVGDRGRNVCEEEDFAVPDFYFGRFTKRNITGNAD